MEKYLAFKKEHFDHFLVNRNIAIIQKSLQSIRKSEIKPMTRHNRVLSSHKINILKTPSISLIKNKSESMISSMKQIGSQKDLSLGKNYIIRTKNLSNMENSKLPKNKINMIRSSIDRNIHNRFTFPVDNANFKNNMLNTVFLKDKTKFTKRNVSILHSVMENEFKQDKRKSFSNKLSSPNAKEDDYPKSERLLGLDQDTSIILNENEFEEKKTQKKKSPKKEKIIKIENSEILKKEKRNMIFSSLIAKALDDEKKKKELDIRVIRKNLILIENTKIHSCRFNGDDSLIAIGCEDGNTRIIAPNQTEILSILSDKFSINNPVTNVRWKQDILQPLLMVTNINGDISLWNIPKKKLINHFVVKDQIFAADCSSLDNKYGIAGIGTYKSKPIFIGLGHSNRVYSLKFHPKHHSLIYSGGWDETILQWDIRIPAKANPTSYIYGPLICGDSIDVSKNEILTGSWRAKNQIEIWDIRKMEKLYGINWLPEKKDEKCYIYSCQFSKGKSEFLAAGCSGTNELRIFKTNENKEFEIFEKIQNNHKGIFSLDFSQNNQYLTYGSSKGESGVLEIFN